MGVGTMEQITMVPLDQLHPHEKNPRIDAASVEDLVESIRVHGIEVPLVAAMHPSGVGRVVLAGHRRLTAALQAGLDEVPVQIRDDLTEARDQLAFMATENILRDQLTAVEESRLVQDMLDLGMSQAQVAQETALGKARVSERVKLGKLTEQSGEKLHRGQISVDEALIIAEYSDDAEAVGELEEAVGTYNFDWYTARAKARRDAKKAVAAAVKQAKKDGLRVVEAERDFVNVHELRSEGMWTTPALDNAVESTTGQEWNDLLAAEHAPCPGHCVRIIERGVDAGITLSGCDQVADQHDASSTATEEATPADPWDEISPEDFAAARISREQHLAKHLPGLDVFDEMKKLAAKKVADHAWTGYGDDASAIAFLEAVTGVEGKSRVTRKLTAWPLEVLMWIDTNWWDVVAHHRHMAAGKQGTSYWGPKGGLRQLLERTDYVWSEPEQRAILLATGVAHDATITTDEPDAALAEGGEKA